MNHYQISKYGAEDDGSWTSVTDIGENFDGVKLTQSNYSDIESLYLEAVKQFVGKLGAKFKIKFLMDLRGEDNSERKLFDMKSPYLKFRGGEYVDINSIPTITQLCLRELMGIRLQTDSDDYICFGYDYYLRLGSPSIGLDELTPLIPTGLFVKEMENDPDE